MKALNSVRIECRARSAFSFLLNGGFIGRSSNNAGHLTGVVVASKQLYSTSITTSSLAVAVLSSVTVTSAQFAGGAARREIDQRRRLVGLLDAAPRSTPVAIVQA